MAKNGQLTKRQNKDLTIFGNFIIILGGGHIYIFNGGQKNYWMVKGGQTHAAFKIKILGSRLHTFKYYVSKLSLILDHPLMIRRKNFFETFIKNQN